MAPILLNRYGTDGFSAYGAGRLRSKIHDYWIRRGFLGIKVWMEKVSGESQGLNNRTSVYIIRSNIGPDGYPPRLPGMAS